MKINKDLPTPLYHQVKNLLEDKIISMEWEAGYQLPTEKELANMLNVSTITVKRAVHELVNKGILYRQRGKGTFVNNKDEKDLKKMVTLRNEKEEDKHYPHIELSFEKIPAGKALGKSLDLSSNELIYSIHRLKMEDDTPVGIEYMYIPAYPFHDLTPEMIKDDLLYNIFTNKYNITLQNAKIYFSTISAREYEAGLLKVPMNEQLFVIERFTFSDQNIKIEYSKFIVRQDKSKYYIDIRL